MDERAQTLDGKKTTVRLFARGGAIGIGRLIDRGDLDFVEAVEWREVESLGHTDRGFGGFGSTGR